jgi:hypothetical protein
MITCFESFLIIQGRFNEQNKNFYILEGFFKVTISYPIQTWKLNGRQLQQSTS